MIYLGCDPGLNGALVSLSYDKKRITISDFKKDEEDRICCRSIYETIEAIKNYHGSKTITCCLEKSQAMPGQGVTSMFNYGVTYGIIYSTIKLSGAKIYELSPQKWKREYGLNSNKKEGIIKTKEDAVNIAAELFPSRTESFKKQTSRSKKGYVLFDGRADAMLISEYCRRNYK